MLTLYTTQSVSEKIKQLKRKSLSIGFVPTMGALHKGHLSLIKQSKQETDITVVSIFVNPKQFNDKNDLDNYPRIIDEDIKKLEKSECDILFLPSVEEMYPRNYTEKFFDLAQLDSTMEGKYRPGHFKGVVAIVSRFFDIIQPHKAFFGEKDFQQLVIIKHIVKQYNYPVKIVACPIVREKDGLAMSSRNILLSEAQRKKAPEIYKTLFESKRLMSVFTVEELKQWVVNKINAIKTMQVEYFEIVDSETLTPIDDWGAKCKKAGCIAVKTGKIRLIDNIKYNL